MFRPARTGVGWAEKDWKGWAEKDWIGLAKKDWIELTEKDWIGWADFCTEIQHVACELVLFKNILVDK